ncbi:MAG: RNA 2',3'-cyclic phosphodiesterase [Spirochaetaceae bacterium]
MKRLFVAFDIDETLRRELEERARTFMDQLLELRKAVRWIPPERYHMTAAFLGDTQEFQLPRIRAVMESFELPQRVAVRLGPPLVFPKPREPRVLVCTLEEGATPLEGITEKLRKGLQEREISFDQKPFRPHLTVGYLRKRPRKVQREVADRWLRERSAQREGGAVVRIALYESVLAPSGPTHSLLFERPFKGYHSER